MVIYEYPNKAQEPNLNDIHTAVAASAMADKNIDYCRWDQDTELLQVCWQEALDAPDKAILDAIVG